MSEATTCAAANTFIDLVFCAQIDLGFGSGSGLGALYIALIAIVFLLSRPFKRARLSTLIRAWRGQKSSSRPPAE